MHLFQRKYQNWKYRLFEGRESKINVYKVRCENGMHVCLKKGIMLHRKLISNVSIFKCRMRLRINELENDLWYFVLRLLFCVLVLFFVLFWFSNFLFFFSFWRPTFICFSLGFWNLSMALSWVHLDPLKLFSSWKGLLQRSSCGWSESSALKKFVLYLMYVRQNWARLARLRQDGQSKMSSAASSQITCKVSCLP